MDLATLALVATGITAIIVGAWQIRAPLATMRQLDATAANLERYDAWRGKRTSLDSEGPTGADEMRSLMRQRVILWGAVLIGGAALVVVGLLL